MVDEKNTNEEELKLVATGRPQDPAEQFPIVAIGGSAGSLQAFEVFFKHLPLESGCAFVIVIHLAPDRNIDVTGLFKQFTPMPVLEARDGISILSNHVYVIPPNKDMGVHRNQLFLFDLSKTVGINRSIDFFLQSLADELWNHAVAIILSGMGNDGELGIRTIKEKLGMVMVQNPASALYKSMPEAAISTNVANFVLDPKDMPKALMNYLHHPMLKDPKGKSAMIAEYQHTILQKILLLLRSHIGHDFTLYKKNTITRRIERRIAVHKLAGFESYFDYISANPHEMDVLFKELLIGVTKFFRDPEAYQMLSVLLHQKILQKQETEHIRIWVAGCSTGEESYSIAMLILEFFDKYPSKTQPKVQIFATDLDIEAIEYARTGFYASNIAEEVSPERLARFFVPKNKGWVVKKDLREMIVFAKHNLIKDAPFTRLDLLSCRNVMIYFSATLQRKLIPVFHYSLNKNGILFIGPAETIGIYNEAFDIINPKWKIFEKNNEINQLTKMIDFPFNIATNPIRTIKNIPSKPLTKKPMANSFHKLLIENYTPSALLVNEKGDILYINGNINKYLQLNTGEAVMNIHKVLREELRYPTGNAIHQVWTSKKSAYFGEVKLELNEKMYHIGIKVDYLKDDEFNGLLLVAFQDYGEVKKRGTNHLNTIDKQAVIELEKDLELTKQQLHNTIEQMESSVEELKSTNEELQSTNEELQSTNEEALTTKEEMQSLNEELMTINLQYHNKAEELTRLNNDMKNLLDNTEIGTIFLDNNLNILRFTPQVTKLFNVIPQDVGRSITHIVSNFDYPAIENAILEVIERLAGKELEVKTKKNDWYNLRIMPYRTTDNFISGAVLTFTKITPLKSLERRLSTLLSYVQTVVDGFKMAAVILDKDQKVLVVNKTFLQLFHLKESDVKEQFLNGIVVNRWRAEKLFQYLTHNVKNDPYFFEHNFPEIGLIKLLVNIQHVSEYGLSEYTASIITFEKQEPDQSNGKQQG
jgi:two-component system CheB/CheR fusion protein